MYLEEIYKFSKNNFLVILFSLIIIALTFGSAINNIFITLLTFYFIYLTITKKQKTFYDKRIIFSIIIFIFFSILSSLQNIYNDFFLESIYRSIFNIRFFLIGFIIYYLFNNLKSFKIFNIILLIYLIILSFDIIFQHYYGVDFAGLSRWEDRAAGFFAYNEEYIAGSFIVKILLPSLFFFKINYKFKFNSLFFIFTLSTIFFALLLTGERASIINFIIILIMFLLIKLFYNKFNLLYFRNYFFLFIIFASIFLFLIQNDAYNTRLINQTKIDFLDSETITESRYVQKFITGKNIFQDKPILGSGPKTFRHYCLDYSLKDLGCSTHPHNMHIEILSEYGLLGYIILCLIIFYFFKKSKFKFSNFNNDYYLILLIVVIISLNPISVTGSFFSSWSAYVFWINFFIMIAYSRLKI